jgi:hypothetical protein
VEASQPRYMKITGAFSTRGGLYSDVEAVYKKDQE